jgi:cobalamin biosynthesis Mg chelatase CobN
MDDNSTPEVVTEDEAINKVKKWVEEMDWEKAQEGCIEILEVDPNNEEIKTLLAQAEKGLAERPTEAVAPGATVGSSMERVITSEAEPTKTVAEQPQTGVQPAATPTPQQPTQATTPAPVTPTATQAPAAEPTPLPQRKSKSTVMIAAIVGFLILALLIIALVFGWLNPLFDWIFSLIG